MIDPNGRVSQEIEKKIWMRKNNWGMPPELAGTPGLTPGQTINMEDFAGRTYTGLPKWAEPYLQEALKGYFGKALSGAQASVSALDRAPQFIDRQVKLANQQYRRDIGAPTSRAVGDAVAAAIGRGVGNSSMLGDTLGRIGGELAGGAQQAHTASNLWGAGQKYQSLKDRLGANMTMAGLMNDFINMSRYSKGYHPMSPGTLGLGFSPV